jgi:hypothetical protein
LTAASAQCSDDLKSRAALTLLALLLGGLLVAGLMQFLKSRRRPPADPGEPTAPPEAPER